MKMKIATALFALAATTGFSDDLVINQPSHILPLEIKVEEKFVSNKSFGYVRLGVSDKDAVHTFETIPALSVGYRYAMDLSAIDMSIGYSSHVAGSTINDTYFYTAPKASYLRYVSADTQPESLYYGAGLAWGGVKKSEDVRFSGFIPSATVGYEMNRDRAFRSFVQFDLSQPAVSVSPGKETLISFKNLPGPLAEVSVGLGY